MVLRGVQEKTDSFLMIRSVDTIPLMRTFSVGLYLSTCFSIDCCTMLHMNGTTTNSLGKIQLCHRREDFSTIRGLNIYAGDVYAGIRGAYVPVQP